MGFFGHLADSRLTFASKLAKSKPSRTFQNHDEPASVSYRYNETVSLEISIGDGYSRKLYILLCHLFKKATQR